MEDIEASLLPDGAQDFVPLRDRHVPDNQNVGARRAREVLQSSVEDRQNASPRPSRCVAAAGFEFGAQRIDRRDLGLVCQRLDVQRNEH